MLLQERHATVLSALEARAVAGERAAATAAVQAQALDGQLRLVTRERNALAATLSAVCVCRGSVVVWCGRVGGFFVVGNSYTQGNCRAGAAPDSAPRARDGRQYGTTTAADSSGRGRAAPRAGRAHSISRPLTLRFLDDVVNIFVVWYDPIFFLPHEVQNKKWATKWETRTAKRNTLNARLRLTHQKKQNLHLYMSKETPPPRHGISWRPQARGPCS